MFLEKIRGNASLENLGLLVLENSTVKRDTWTSKFSEVVFALDFPEESVTTPVVPQTERIPGESVYIPDANLRAAIAEALGKVPGATITVAEMTTLTHLAASGMDIQDLEGLQFATNLEKLRLRGNPLSDLSPLAGLTTLKEIKISGELLSDLSPLAGLINLEGVGFWETSISDLSPLAGLTKLRWLEFKHSPVSNLSPLVGLTGLKRLETYASRELDLLPLKGLTNLIRLGVASSGVLDVSPLAGLINLEWLSIQSNRISDISPLASLKNLKELNLSSNQISDVSPLAALHNLEEMQLQRNNISDISSLDGLRENTEIFWFRNPGFPQGGPKIEGPWLWVLVPGSGFRDGADLLSQASNGAVTELGIATSRATEGTLVGENMWTSHKIAPVGGDNIREMLNAIDMEGDDDIDNVVYGSVTLYLPREQQTQVFAGSDNNHKIWLNGEFIHENLSGVWARDYQDYFPVTLKQGTNVLLVAVESLGGEWSGFFGFAPEAEYTVVSPGTGFAFSTDATSVRVGDMFTLRINAEKVTDLAGWQFDLTFDPDVLEAVEVSEGDFLKANGGNTFFLQGTIDNTAGKITGISAALISESGVSGTGPLLSVTFMAKAGGETQVTLENFEFGSITGDIIPAVAPEIISLSEINLLGM